MKISKRILAAGCTLCLLVGCLTGCKDKETSGKNDGMYEVKVWASDKGAKSAMEKLVSEWNDTIGKKEKIKINYETVDGDFNQQVDLALANGTAPDIFPTSKLEQQALNGQLQAIDKLEGGKEFLAPFLEKTTIKKYNDSYFAVPNKTITAGLLYNKDMFKAAGIVDENGEATPPETFDEMLEYAKKLTNPDKRKYGIIFPGKSAAWYTYDIDYMIMSTVGHIGFDPVTEKYDFMPIKPIYEFILQLKEDGSCYPGTEAIDADPARARFAEGNVGMKFGISWDVGVLTDQFPAECDWGVAPLPVLDKDNCYKQLKSVYNGFVMKKIEEGSDAEKIFKVYQWLHGDELQIELYERGINLPWDFDIVADIDTSALPSQWVEFGEIMKISASGPAAITCDTSGATNISIRFVNEVWNGGRKNIDKVLKEWTDICNAGVELYKKNNPDYVPDLSRNETLDLKR